MEVDLHPSSSASNEVLSPGAAPHLISATERAPVFTDAGVPLTTDPSPDAAPWDRLLLLSALTLGVFWSIESTDYDHAQWWTAALLLAAVLAGAALLRGVRIAPWLVLAQAAAVGVADRVVRTPFVSSDVLPATREAMRVIARGDNPYSHVFENTIPRGSQFAYPPGEIAFYAIPNAIFGGISHVDQWAGIGIVLLLAGLWPLIGVGRAALATALYATFGLAAFRATDGSNDTSLAFLLVLATVLLAWSERPGQRARWFFYGSAVIFGWAILFKQLALLVYPFVALYLRRRGLAWQRHATIAVGLAALVSLPFFITAPVDFTRQMARVGAHDDVWGLNLWAALQSVAPGFVDAISPAIPVTGVIAIGLTAWWLLRHPASTLSGAIFQGLALLFVTFFLANWTTSSYYTGAGALLATAAALAPATFWTSLAWGSAGTTLPGLPLMRRLASPSAAHLMAGTPILSRSASTEDGSPGEPLPLVSPTGATLTSTEVDAASVMTASPAAAPEDRLLLLTALTLGVFWAIESTDYEHTQWWTAGLLLAAVPVGAALLRGLRFAPWLVLAHAVAVGFADRVTRPLVGGSDVILVTKEAIGVIGRGENPYTHYYETTNPPGSPFAYLPGELLFHAIPNALFGGIDRVHQWSGIGIVLLLAALAPLVGPGRAALATALYGTFGLAAYRAMDGSNDTGLGFLLVLAAVLLAGSQRPSRGARLLFFTSAVIFGWALCYKQFAALVYPFVLLSLRRRGDAWRHHGAIAIGIPLVATLPFLLLSPAALLSSTTAGLTWHEDVWGLNLWAGLRPLAPGFVDTMNPAIEVLAPLVLLALAVAFAVRPSASFGISLLQGLGVLFAALFLARWTTSPYYTGAGALLAAAVALIPAGVWTPQAWGAGGARLPTTMAFEGQAPLPATPPRGAARPLSGVWQRWKPPLPDRSGSDRAPTTPWLRAQSLGIVAPLLLAAVLAGGILRFEGLSGLPAGLNQDEAVNGYDAYSLIHTGRDHHGHPFPFAGLESFGDWSSPLLTFLTAPVVGLFGLRLGVIRAVTAAVGLAAVPIVYWLAVELFGRRSIGLAAAWLLALSPWAIHLSRWAIPTSIVPTMVAATMLAIVWTARRRSGHGLIVAATLAGLTIASYPTMKLFVPLVVLVALVVYGRDLLRIDRASIVGAALVLLAIAGPILFLSTFDPGGRARLDQVSAFHNGPDLGLFIRQYRSYLAPHFLFYRGDGDAMHLPTGYGVELRSTIPILLWGLVWLLAMTLRPRLARWRSVLFLLGVLVVYPIPGSLTAPSPHALRAAQLIPLTALIGAVGIVTGAELVMRLIRRAQPVSARGALAVIWTLPLLLFFGTEVVSRSQQYHDRYPDDTAYLYQDGLVPALTFAREHAADVDEIWVADVNQPYIYVLFEAQWSPSDVHDHLRLRRDPPQFNVVQEIGNYHFATDTSNGPPPEIQAAMDNNSLVPLFEDSYPQGSPAYQVRVGDVPGHGRVLVVDRV